MKRLAFFILFMSCLAIIRAEAQSMSCQELLETVTTHYDSKDYTLCFNSSMLIKVEYYELEDMGFAVAYIRQNDYDLYGSPYIFCGITNYQWTSFKSAGIYSSWGQAFHKYIRDYTCNCY